MGLLSKRDDSNIENIFNDDLFNYKFGRDNFFNDMKRLFHEEYELLREEEDEYVLEMYLPGVKKDEVSIELNGNELKIKTDINRKKHEEKGLRNYLKNSYFKYILNNGCDHKNINAELIDGILKIKVPKIKSNNTNKKIEIR